MQKHSAEGWKFILASKMGSNKKDYTVYIGQKIGMLTIVGVRPRERDAQGFLKPARFYVQCDCGKLKEVEASNLLSSGQKSCGCQRGINKRQKESAEQKAARNTAIFARLHPKWECPYPFESCTISSTCYICCHECDKPCKQCFNSPEQCGAKSRKHYEKNKVKEKDYHELLQKFRHTWTDEVVARTASRRTRPAHAAVSPGKVGDDERKKAASLS